MVKGAGFKLHGEGFGPRLEGQVGLGASNWARRFASVEDGDIAAERPDRGLDLRPRAVRVEMARAAVTASKLKVMKGRGRPRVEGERPWEAAGVSRRTWERRKKVLKGMGSHAGE
jgi:hypothetical protein